VLKIIYPTLSYLILFLVPPLAMDCQKHTQVLVITHSIFSPFVFAFFYYFSVFRPCGVVDFFVFYQCFFTIFTHIFHPPFYQLLFFLIISVFLARATFRLFADFQIADFANHSPNSACAFARIILALVIFVSNSIGFKKSP